MSHAAVIPLRPQRRHDPMTAAAHDVHLFENAPPRRVLQRLGLVRRGARNALFRAGLVILIAWVPLVVFSAIQRAASPQNDLFSLLLETGVHARFLIAAPLLILAETECATRLGVIIHHFVESGIVPQNRRGRFEAAVSSTQKLLDSHWAEVAVVVLAYVVTVALIVSSEQQIIPEWHRTGGLLPLFSLAGWWHALVSTPLLLILFFGWAWRIALWTRLLWLISRIKLRLVAAHPDHAAGLGFVGNSLRAFSIVALALAAIVAGRSASVVIHGGTLPTPQLAFNAAVLSAIAVVLIAPLSVFMPTLMQVWRRGVLEYGALADRVGNAFERKWIDRSAKLDREALAQPDFSATTDLYQIVSNVYAIRFIPLGLKDVVTLVAAMLLPFIPVVLLAIPTDVIWSGIKGLLF